MASNDQSGDGAIATLKNDPDAWAAGILALGSAAAKLLSMVEHIDFLMSVTDGHFKTIFDFWDSIGWFFAAAGGLAWLLARLMKPTTQKKSLTWGIVFSVGLMAFVFGSIWTTISSNAIPRVILGWGAGCNATLDTSRLQSFSSKYNLALVCFLADPTIDPLNDKKIVVSNFFTILPGGLSVVADATQIMPKALVQVAPTSTPSPLPPATTSQPVPTQAVSITMNYIAILVPKDISRDKFSTLGDLERLGGKLLDPKFYKD